MKKQILLSLCITLGTTPLWADELNVDGYATSIDIYASAEQAPTQPETQAKIEIQPAAQVEASSPAPLQMPGLSREDNAALHLSILRDEVDNMTQVGFFGSLFSANEELQQALMQDIELFLSIYSDLSITADVMLLKGEMFAKQNQPESAAIAWLQTMYEFPKTDAALNAKQQVLDLIDSDWDDYASDIKAITKQVPSAEKPQRLRKLINQLYPLNDKAMVAALTLLQLDFLKRFSNDPHDDEVQILLAHNMGAESAEAGIFGFKKLLALYPNSSYRPEAMLAIADLQRTRLKAYENAENNYKALIESYPDHKLIKNAYMSLAITQAEHLKKYADAVQTYKDVVKLYPENKVALKAMQNMAKLQTRKTNEPEKAVVTLRKLATMFHGFEATDALDDAIKIASKQLKDEKLAFEIRQQLIQDYPSSDEAPKALFAMAEYMEKQGDTEQAKAFYNQLLQQYPDHKLVRKVRKKLKR